MVKDMINKYRTAKEEFNVQSNTLRRTLFNKIASRIFELVDKGYIEQEDEEVVCLALPLAICDVDDDDNWHYYIYLELHSNILYGLDYKGYIRGFQLRELKYGGSGYVKEIRETQDYIELYESLDRMRFWDDNYNIDY